ncbi:hypothetical protein PVK06_017188 [Gossypium arboreum]|uniref:Uncharacterized protein n=1 Tax=Gossypium arboreum TaxID=29729 RepID=A0ABR0Q377_GOSAR|nr:hypothetical protein PVK06_017188 [Gossypium arboreum]
MQKKLAKIQQDMRDQMLEFQRNVMGQLTQLLAGGLEKGKSPMVNSRDNNEVPPYHPSFTPTNTQPQPNMYPQRMSVNIRPQYQTGTSTQLNFPMDSGYNLGDDLTNPIIFGLDGLAETKKARVELPKQFEDRYKQKRQE